MNEIDMKCRRCSKGKDTAVVTKFNVVGEGVTKTNLKYVKMVCATCGMKAVKITGKAI